MTDVAGQQRGQCALEVSLSTGRMTLAQLIIRNLDDADKAGLRPRAARRGQSVEEVREIL